jgi:ankyrin repeat protein
VSPSGASVRRLFTVASLGALGCLVAPTLSGRAFTHAAGNTAARVDFAREVRPLLAEHCYECHGPDEHKNGYRLDRRSRALAGVLRPNIIPGDAAASRLYVRVSSTLLGTQMPPREPLAPDQIALLKAWIDEGAEWPDTLANEADWPKPDPAATKLIDAIRLGNRPAVASALERDPRVLAGADADGFTPLMTAALSGDTALVRRMLDAGANPNAASHEGLSALICAVDDLEAVRLLLRHGADPNAMSDFKRTALQLAAGQRNGTAVVQALLDAGAEAKQPSLVAAAAGGHVEAIRLLLKAGVVDTGEAAIAALRGNCVECFEAIAAAQPGLRLPTALEALLPPIGAIRPDVIRLALDRGANVNGRDRRSLTPILRVVAGDFVERDAAKMLIDRGADLAVTSPDGWTALDYARRLGRAPVVDLLTESGGASGVRTPPHLIAVHGNTIHAAVGRSVPLLQRAGVEFYRKSGCISCHSNSLTAMTVTAARAKKFTVDEAVARQEAETAAKDMRQGREQTLQGMTVPGGGPTSTGYILIGLAAQGHPRDASTDALVRLLTRTQRSDGRWFVNSRVPSEASEFTAVAVCIRGIRLYSDAAPGSPERKAIDDGIAWLVRKQPASTEDRVFRVFGLTWGHGSRDALRSAVADLVATQRADGGWAQLPSLHSDAYATGSALNALRESGMAVGNPVYRRGVRFLLDTQLQDGSWFVAKRTHPTQIYFDSGFPHGADQYISTAATNWATQALIAAAR